MAGENRQDAYAHLMELATQQGYVTFDNVFEVTERWQLPVSDVDWLSNSIAIRGVLVYEKPPIKIYRPEIKEYRDYAQGDYEEVFRKVIAIEPSLAPFINEIRKIRPPQQREFAKLIHLAKEGNAHARDRLVEMYLRMAVRVGLQRAEQYDEDVIDCIGNAYEGLIIAVDRYNPKTNGAFGSYAALWMLQNVSREQSTKRPEVYYPANKKEKYFTMYPVLKNRGCTTCDEIGRCDKVRELVKKRLKCSRNKVEEIILQMTPFNSYEVVLGKILQDVKGCRGERKKELTRLWFEQTVVYEDLLDKRICENIKEAVTQALAKLSDREKKVIMDRYGILDGKEKTLEEVGLNLGVTRERVRQIELKAIRKLRHSSCLTELFPKIVCL